VRRVQGPKLRVAILEQELGHKAERQLLPMQPGDCPGDLCRDLARDVDFRPGESRMASINLRRGIEAIITVTADRGIPEDESTATSLVT
jgi:hypothetical protein